MKPAPFEYHDPGTTGDVVALLEQYGGDAKILAGGQSLMPLLNMRLARPAALIDINKVTGLETIRESNGGLAIGALVRQRAIEMSGLVRERQPMLEEATRLVAHPQIRNRGTVGGSLAHADPAAEYPAVAVALGATLTAVGSGGERTIEADDFFVTYLTTALEPTEVLTEVRFPAQPGHTGWSIKEVARRHGDFALAGVAATVTTDDAGLCTGSRIVVFGVGPMPNRARQAEAGLLGAAFDERLLERVGETASAEVEDPMADVHGTSEYRQHLAKVLTQRALAEAWSRTGTGPNSHNSDMNGGRR